MMVIIVLVLPRTAILRRFLETRLAELEAWQGGGTPLACAVRKTLPPARGAMGNIGAVKLQGGFGFLFSIVIIRNPKE